MYLYYDRGIFRSLLQEPKKGGKLDRFIGENRGGGGRVSSGSVRRGVGCRCGCGPASRGPRLDRPTCWPVRKS